jgi:hypothetical protein
MPPDAMDLATRLERDHDRFSPAQQALARYLLGHLGELPMMSAHEVAREAHCSPATVVRFAQALGFAGYPDLQRTVRRARTGLGAAAAAGGGVEERRAVTSLALRLEGASPVLVAGDGGALPAVVAAEDVLLRAGRPVLALCEGGSRARAWLGSLPPGAGVLAVGLGEEARLADVAVRAAQAAEVPAVAIAAGGWGGAGAPTARAGGRDLGDEAGLVALAVELARALTAPRSGLRAVGA